LMETQKVSGNFMNISNPISLGPAGSSGNNAMIDNFSIYSRALSDVRSGADKTANRYYFDLQGRRVENPAQPGIYIQKGRKLIVK